MTLVKFVAAVAVTVATLPAAFAQAGPQPVVGEGYPAGVSTQVRQDLSVFGTASTSMPDYDFVGGEVGYGPHQHEKMAQDELRTRAMGYRGEGSPSESTRVQSAREIAQYLRAGG